MEGRGLLCLFLALAIGLTALSSMHVLQEANASSLKTFSNYEELKQFIETKLEEAKVRQIPWIYPEAVLFRGFFGGYGTPVATPVPSEALAPKAAAIEYSKTNVQVEGVDEADLVKTDGEYIYTVSGNEVYVVKAYPPEDMRVCSKISLGEGRTIGLFVNEDRLVVIKSGRFPIKPLESGIVPPHTCGVSVRIYDISDVENPVLIKGVNLDGSYVSSRMIKGYVYVVTAQPVFKILGEDFVLPRIAVDREVKEIPPTKTYYSNDTIAPLSYTIIAAINALSGEVEGKAILTGYATCIYASLNNIYVVVPKWDGWFNDVRSEIHRIRVDGMEIECEASGEVPGRVLNQFSMDEYKGYFRIATTIGHVARYLSQATSLNNVYVLDAESLEIVGKLEGLAPGERIHSARFMGDRCYLVTFRKVDPLFTIDLSDPENPKVLGKLKIPGYSDYLHPYDGNYLIGIGKETVPAEEGDFSWYQGVKISLFDVSNVTMPKEVDKVVIGDRGTDTPVLRDHHALLFDKKRNLLVIPILEARVFPEKYGGEAPPWMHGEYVFQGAYVFHISPEDGIRVRGKITHLEDQELTKSGYYLKSKYEIKRSLLIDDVLYTISDGKVKANSLRDLSEISEVNLT